jgi:ParB family chromosome partitioning protein
MGRKIFGQRQQGDPAASPSLSPEPPPKPAKVPGSIGGLRDSLRDITSNSIRDIDPNQIDEDGVRDRLAIDDASIMKLAESIEKYGQQVPVMVRPSDRPDRFRIVYGRRRLAAIRKIGGTVKAIVRSLDDQASLLAQGQENNLRLDPSFIEKAFFIKDMEAAGYEPAIIRDALGLNRQAISHHRVVIEQLPEDVIRRIGPAHGVGRRQWNDLAGFASTLPLSELAQDVLSGSAGVAESSDRFKAVLAAAQVKSRLPSSIATLPIKLTLNGVDGHKIASLTRNERAVTITVDRKVHPKFSQWIEDNAEAVVASAFDRWKKEHGSNS